MIADSRHFGIAGVLRRVARGAPFVWRSEDLAWDLVRVPRFPAAFSALAGALAMVINISKAGQAAHEPLTATAFLLTVFVSLIGGAVLFAGLNVVIMGGFWLSLSVFKSRGPENTGSALLAATQRVSYFSTVFQPLLILMFVGLFLAESHVAPFGSVAHALALGVLAFGILRLMAVFQSMRRETGGRVSAGLSGMLFCFDVWAILLQVGAGYVESL